MRGDRRFAGRAGNGPGGGAEFVLTLPGPELGDEEDEADAADHPEDTPTGAAAPAS